MSDWPTVNTAPDVLFVLVASAILDTFIGTYWRVLFLLLLIGIGLTLLSIIVTFLGDKLNKLDRKMQAKRG